MDETTELDLLELLWEGATDKTFKLVGWPGVFLIFLPWESQRQNGLYLRAWGPEHQLCRTTGGSVRVLTENQIIDLFTPPVRIWNLEGEIYRFLRSACGIILVEPVDQVSKFPDLQENNQDQF